MRGRIKSRPTPCRPRRCVVSRWCSPGPRGRPQRGTFPRFVCGSSEASWGRSVRATPDVPPCRSPQLSTGFGMAWNPMRPVGMKMGRLHFHQVWTRKGGRARYSGISSAVFLDIRRMTVKVCEEVRLTGVEYVPDLAVNRHPSSPDGAGTLLPRIAPVPAQQRPTTNDGHSVKGLAGPPASFPRTPFPSLSLLASSPFSRLSLSLSEKDPSSKIEWRCVRTCLTGDWLVYKISVSYSLRFCHRPVRHVKEDTPRGHQAVSKHVARLQHPVFSARACDATMEGMIA